MMKHLIAPSFMILYLSSCMSTKEIKWDNFGNCNQEIILKLNPINDAKKSFDRGTFNDTRILGLYYADGKYNNWPGIDRKNGIMPNLLSVNMITINSPQVTESKFQIIKNYAAKYNLEMIRLVKLKSNK